MNVRKTAVGIVAALAIGAALGTALPAIARSFGIPTTPAACSDCASQGSTPTAGTSCGTSGAPACAPTGAGCPDCP
jgi:hypothetical protein